MKIAIEELSLTRENAVDVMKRLRHENRSEFVDRVGGEVGQKRGVACFDSDSSEEEEEEEEKDSVEEEDKSRANKRQTKKPQHLIFEGATKEDLARSKAKEKDEDEMRQVTAIIISRQRVAQKSGWTLCKVCAIENVSRCEH